MPVKYKVIKKAQDNGVATDKVRQPSLRAIQAVKNVVENGGNKGRAMIDAGFSPATAKTPEKVFGAVTVVRNLIDPIVDKMIKERDQVMALMVKKRKNANYAVLAMTLRSLTHDIQVLTNKPTEIIDKPLESEEEAFLRAILSRNS